MEEVEVGELPHADTQRFERSRELPKRIEPRHVAVNVHGEMPNVRQQKEKTEVTLRPKDAEIDIGAESQQPFVDTTPGLVADRSHGLKPFRAASGGNQVDVAIFQWFTEAPVLRSTEVSYGHRPPVGTTLRFG